MNNEYLDEAKEELKRVDHIIYVSLKYTRTVDIIRNALKRMVSAFEYIIEGILWHNYEKKEIERMPMVSRTQIELLHQLYPDDRELERFLKFYLFLRELIKAPYTKSEEYRRHVTMIAKLKNQTAEVDIDMLEDDFDKVSKEFMEYAERLVGLRKEEE